MKKILPFLLLIIITNINPLLAQWIQSNWSLSSNARCFAVSGNQIFVGTNSQGVFHSTDGGTDWTQVNSGLTNDTIQCLGVYGTNIFAGTPKGIYLSTNEGTSWTSVNTDLANTSIRAFAVIDSYLFVGTLDGIFRSTDNGKNGVAVNSGLSSNVIHYLAVVGTTLFTGVLSSQAYRSTDYGANWTLIKNTGVYEAPNVVANGKLLFIIGGPPIISTDYGISWSACGVIPSPNPRFPYANVSSLAFNGSDIFAATNGSGIYISSDSGKSWSAVNSGLLNSNDKYVSDLVICGSNLFARTNTGIWRRPLSELITGIKDNVYEVPIRFELHQNFPNPFNPSTTFSFDLYSKSFVTLLVYDALGRKIATLVSEELSPGTYVRQWSGESLSSGIYFYRLQAGLNTETKKLVLLR